MCFLANENFPGEGVEALATAGHDVDWVRVSAPGMRDEQVLGRAVRDGRILLTFDKDFGELAWSRGLPASCGIVLFRIPMPPANVGALLAGRIAERQDWSGHFSVIEPSRVRMRPLPLP
jgi:predicted nuclease of predicted toxin-antitoxin system